MIRPAVLAACLLTVLIGWERIGSGPVTAESDRPIWNPPFTVSNTPQNSEIPAIIADPYGYVHLFWDEDLGGAPFEAKGNPQTGNSIMYTRWDGGFWTKPVDILSVPGDSVAKFVSVTLDADSRLHVVWTGQSNIYYSHAPSSKAGLAGSWSKPIAIASDSARTAWESSVTTDWSGNLHIVYATRGSEPGVYHVRSLDGGSTWEAPVILSRPLDRLETGFSNVRIIVDGAGRLQVAWQTIQQQGFGQAIYHARSVDEGETWSWPVQLRYRGPGDTWVEFPYLVAVGASELHLIYVDGTNVGRAHRISEDGGATWGEPRRIITDMEGINGYVFPLVDATGEMYLIINMRTRSQVGGLYYARWLGGKWSPVQLAADSDPTVNSAHYAVGTVRLGNELHIAWTELNTGEIGYMYGTIPTVAQTPAWSASAVALPSPESVPTAVIRSEAATATPGPAQSAHSPVGSMPRLPFLVDPVMAASASLLLVAGAVLWARVRAR